MSQTSRVFDSWDHLVTKLEEVTWPQHPKTGKAPKVVDGDMPTPYPAEMIIIVGSIPSPTAEWATMGSSQSQNQEFVLQAVVSTRVPKCTARQARARLGELCDTFQSTFRSTLSGKQLGGFDTEAGSPGPYGWLLTPPNASVFMIEGGFAGWAEINIRFNSYL